MFNAGQVPLNIDSGPYFTDRKVQLFIRRLDLIDPVYGGNKWFKLKYNILKAQSNGFSKIVTFGGAFSNHIAATARVGAMCGIKTVGIIRGEKESENNPTLSRAAADGMQLIFCSREDYRRKQEPGFLNKFTDLEDDFLMIPEGGSNAEGVKGTAEIIDASAENYDFITVCCGTGATAAGLLTKMNPDQKLIGFSVLKDKGSIETAIENHLQSVSFKPLSTWNIEHDFHFGGYGKSNSELHAFILKFYMETSIPIEPVYTGKMFFGLSKMIANNVFLPGKKILAIHTGGLQYLKTA